MTKLFLENKVMIMTGPVGVSAGDGQGRILPVKIKSPLTGFDSENYNDVKEGLL